MKRTVTRLAVTFEVKAGTITLEQRVSLSGARMTPARLAAAIALLSDADTIAPVAAAADDAVNLAKLGRAR